MTHIVSKTKGDYPIVNSSVVSRSDDDSQCDNSCPSVLGDVGVIITNNHATDNCPTIISGQVLSQLCLNMH